MFANLLSFPKGFTMKLLVKVLGLVPSISRFANLPPVLFIILYHYNVLAFSNDTSLKLYMH